MTLNANFTFQDATAFGTGFFQESGNYLDGYTTTTSVDGTHGTGVGAPNFTSYSPPTGRMRAPGIPQMQANIFLEYKFPEGYGFGDRAPVHRPAIRQRPGHAPHPGPVRDSDGLQLLFYL